MSEHKVIHSFTPGERVYINGDIPATIDQCIWSRLGCTYRCEWWYEGNIKVYTFYEDEITRIQPKPSFPDNTMS